jgi:hypothetical protein
MPVITANAIAQALDSVARQFEHAEAPQREAFELRETQALRDLWGADFDGKTKAVEAFLNQQASRSQSVARMLSEPRTRYAFADRRIWVSLSQWLSSRR